MEYVLIALFSLLCLVGGCLLLVSAAEDMMK